MQSKQELINNLPRLVSNTAKHETQIFYCRGPGFDQWWEGFNNYKILSFTIQFNIKRKKYLQFMPINSDARLLNY